MKRVATGTNRTDRPSNSLVETSDIFRKWLLEPVTLYLFSPAPKAS